MARIAMNAFTPEQLAAQRIAEMQRLERDRANRQLPPGLYREFTGREEFEARGPGQAGPPMPQVPGDVAGPGAEEQITDEQVAQFLGRMPYRNAGRGPGEALEGVRIQGPRRMQREDVPEPAAPAVNALQAEPGPAGFGAGRPMDRALAAEVADRERTQEKMDAQIGARRRGEDAARARGFKDEAHRQEATIPRAVLRGQWAAEQQKRHGGDVEAYYDLYDKYSIDGEGNVRDHRAVQRAIASTGVLDLARRKRDQEIAPVPKEQRQAAVRARADQYNKARRLGVPQSEVMLAEGFLGAQSPMDLAKHAAAAEAVRPGRGFGNLGALIGGEAVNAEAVAGLGDGRQTPVQKMQADREIVRGMPMGQRAQGYRDMHRAQNAGQPMNPEQENLFLVNEGAGDASTAANSVISGKADPEGMAFLREWTNSFTAAGEGTGRQSYEKWRRRLGLQNTQQSIQLWKELTGVNVHGWFEAPPSARMPAGGDGKPAPKPHQVSPRAAR